MALLNDRVVTQALINRYKAGVPVGIGLGMIAYGFAVAFFTTLSVWRIGRRDG
mgnify:CR=1 FL=1